METKRAPFPLYESTYLGLGLFFYLYLPHLRRRVTSPTWRKTICLDIVEHNNNNNTVDGSEKEEKKIALFMAAGGKWDRKARGRSIHQIYQLG